MIFQLKPEICFEIGVGQTQIRSQQFWKENTKCVLFEPEKESYLKLITKTEEFSNVVAYNCAIGDKNGEDELVVNGDCSFLATVNSPMMQNNKACLNQYPHVKIPVKTIDNFDEGNIDVLFVDTEGAEWFVLKHLISRPDMIVLEMYANYYYVNSFTNEILEWMRINDYFCFHKTESDMYFLRSVYKLLTRDRNRLCF